MSQWEITRCEHDDDCIVITERLERGRQYSPHLERIIRESMTPWDAEQVLSADIDSGEGQSIHIPATALKGLMGDAEALIREIEQTETA